VAGEPGEDAGRVYQEKGSCWRWRKGKDKRCDLEWGRGQQFLRTIHVVIQR
jgi:hypothetical protein